MSDAGHESPQQLAGTGSMNALAIQVERIAERLQQLEEQYAEALCEEREEILAALGECSARLEKISTTLRAADD